MISDKEARDIAFAWHGGGSSALYAFASTGAINTARVDHDIQQEIGSCVFSPIPSYDQTKDLLDLEEYTRANEPRAAVAGWSALPLDPSPQEQPR